MDNGTLMLNGTSYSGNGGTLVVNGISYSGGGGTDVSDTTATPEDVLLGKVFHLANGDRAEGTLVPPKVASGVFSLDNYAIQNINLGFKPKQLLCVKDPSNTGRWAGCAYDERLSTTKYFRLYGNGSNIGDDFVDFGTTAAYSLTINSISDTSVEIYSNVRSSGTYYYFAIG